MDPVRARSCAFLLPSRAAASELRRTFEITALGSADVNSREAALCLPDLLTRNDWYLHLYKRLRTTRSLLNELEREVVMTAAAREAVTETPPPFRLRPGLIVEIVRLYDALQRLQSTVEAFERRLITDLEGDADTDKGAARLLLQTRFLASTFRRYQALLTTHASLDEHCLRQHVLEHPLKSPYTHIVVAVADCAAEPEGIWPADFDLLTRLPLLSRIDVVATEQSLAAGFHDRLLRFLPGIDEEWIQVRAERSPVLLVPGNQPDERFFRSRDREEELCDLVRRLKAAGAQAGRTAVVFKRPLPYVYLAQEVFGSGGVPYRTSDALPLAAEPYAAALDLVFEFVSSSFSRAATVALLRSPHFSFANDGESIDDRAIAMLDRRLRDVAYLGGLEQLRDLVTEWSHNERTEGVQQRWQSAEKAAVVALTVAGELASLLEPAAASQHLATFQQFLRTHERLPMIDDPLRDRQLRARAAIHAAIESLRDAHHRIDDPPVEFSELVAALRRWIENQTFAPRAGSAGVQFVDAQTVRFGSFDNVHLLGLVESDWPDRAARNIFFPAFLLQQHFGWPAEADRLRAVRAAFQDLLRLPHRQLSLSTFALDDDAVVGPSVFLEELVRADLEVVQSGASRFRAFPFEAISQDPISERPLRAGAAGWLSLRRSRTDSSSRLFHGKGSSHQRETYAVGALETYLDCPFKFFAKHVLRLDEEQQDENARRTQQQGIFLHRVFQAFFEEWTRMGQAAITLHNLPVAREVFGRVVEPLLAELPEGDAALERNRVFGSAAAEGLADVVFRIEAEWGVEVMERLLEYRLDGAFEIQGPEGSRRVALTGIADRIDLLEDGTLRVIDYKSGRAPHAKRMLQLPVYSVCASQQLDGRHGRTWAVGEGGYIAFKDPRRFVPLADRDTLGPVLQDAQTRLLGAINQIEAGEFSPTPLELFRCTFCGYSGVCRKDYVGDE